jgi:hypothetical protein
LTGFFHVKKLKLLSQCGYTKIKTIMKTKDVNWVDEKIQDIKRRKRRLKLLQDPELVKKSKRDLKREYRGVKRSEKNFLREWIKSEIQ